MTRRFLLFFTLLVMACATLEAHDLFLKPERFFVAPPQGLRVRVINGTFDKSENAIDASRVADLSIVTAEGRTKLDTAKTWAAEEPMSVASIGPLSSGVAVIGASTLPRELELTGKEFNEYLKGDGVPDVLDDRKAKGELERSARERYSKHVKTIVQAGDGRSGKVDTVLGYPAELVPLADPYALKTGETLPLKALVDGRPVANQYVLAGGRTPDGRRQTVQALRSDADGIVRVRLAARGQWYVKFIHMVRLSGDPTADYESKWASLTFEVR